jgi:hypothetical protein
LAKGGVGKFMDEITITFNPSAFKHGIGEEDIRIAIEQFVYNEIMEDDEKNIFCWVLTPTRIYSKSYIM